MFGRGAAGAVWQEGVAFRNLVRDEIRVVREHQQILLTQGKTGHATIFILSSCCIANILVFLAIPDYISLFIAASLYLHMGYFITLLIPIGKGTIRFPREEIHRFFSTLYHTGIIAATDRFTRILLNAFFINSRSLFFGISCIFSVDILFTLTGFYAGMFSERTVLIILFQLFSFLIFYFLLWRLEPGSVRFQEGVSGVKGALAVRYPSWLIAVLFGTAALLILLLILSTIILLPGMTLAVFMSNAGLEHVTDLFLLIGIIGVSQYFIVRFFHGIASVRMAERFSASTLSLLQAAGGGDGPLTGEDPDADRGILPSADAMRSAASALLQARLYRLELNTLFGAFPVYTVNPDFSVIFDEQVISVITGYLKGAGSTRLETA